MRNLNRLLMATGAAVALGGGTAGCEFLPKNPHVKPAVEAKMRTTLQPTAERIAKVILDAYGDQDGTYYYSDDDSVPGGEEVTADFRDADYDWTLTADIKPDAKGDLLPAGVYYAEIDGTHCKADACGSDNWDLDVAATDSFSSPNGGDFEQPVWNGEEDLYAPWDTKEKHVIAKTISHLKHPGAGLNSGSTQEAVKSAEQLAYDAKVALDSAQMDPSYGYGKIGEPQTNP